MKRSFIINEKNNDPYVPLTTPSLQILPSRFFRSSTNALVKSTITTVQGDKINPELLLGTQLYQVNKKGEVVQAEKFRLIVNEQLGEFNLIKVLFLGNRYSKKREVIENILGHKIGLESGMGVHFHLLHVNNFCQSDHKLAIWEVSWSEINNHLMRHYYKQSFFAFIVVNVTDGTYDLGSNWKKQVDIYQPDSKFFSILLVNTQDLSNERYLKFKLEKWELYAKNNGYAQCFQIDPVREINMSEAIKFALNQFSRLYEDLGEEYTLLSKPSK